MTTYSNLLHSPAFSIAHLLAQWNARQCRQRRLRAMRRELSSLEARELGDLAIGRSEVAYWLDLDAASAERSHAGEQRRG